jgi:hypothetical protein
MARLRSQPASGSRTKRGSPSSFTLRTSAGIGIGRYPSRERAMSAARWVVGRSGEHVDVMCERTGQVWDVSPADA